MYLYGQEVEKNYVQAIGLLTEAADQGNPYASYLLEHCHSGADKSHTGIAALRLIARLLQIFRENLRREENGRPHIEKKLRKKIAEKMELHGQHTE